MLKIIEGKIDESEKESKTKCVPKFCITLAQDPTFADLDGFTRIMCTLLRGRVRWEANFAKCISCATKSQ